ncbi:ECF transporter S component [Streptococcus henryi]|uniref:ECF transporter S component n=1 Tax=Streptococcus henryi TaxID=439219 RepID=UPI00036D61E2|nr:ECF transporter S component [Streptococcus henryi]
MPIKRLTVAAFFMALVIILSSSPLSIPVPGGHFYFNGIIIFLVALIFPPAQAVIIAGIGSFLGDFFFYPAPMFVTLATHSLQVLVISALVVNKNAGKIKVITALLLGGIVDIIGYYLGRSYVYANVSYAILKLPFDIVAVILGAAITYFIYYHTSFLKQFNKSIRK